MSDIEFELKKRFDELRVDDEANAPAFATIRDHAVVIPANSIVLPGRRWMTAVLFVAAAVVVAIVWITTRSRSERIRQEASLRDSSANVMHWTMPTDGLLESARQTLQTSALFGSVLDAAAVPIRGNPIKGD